MQHVGRTWRLVAAAVAAAAATLATIGVLGAQGNSHRAPVPKDRILFTMIRSAAAQNAGCLAGAQARVNIKSLGPVERMRVDAEGLPANTDFDFFVIQVPNAPFGLAWYQGDLESNARGKASGTFVGRFNTETFIVAPGTAPAPKVHDADATTNPQTAPVHTFHLGVWFNDPKDAAAAGCPNTVTPFNGDHTAGIQALSTRNSTDDQGPLRQLEP
jgi:hypothetical protein